jgi:small subunit ribosomal protein S15
MDDGDDDSSGISIPHNLIVDDTVSTNDDDDDTSADDYLVSVGELETDDDQDVGMEDDGQLPGWAISAQRIQEVRAQYRRHETDTGSPEYQVAGMTERINYLTKHLQLHPKDFSTRRGLVALVNKRRRLLNYLAREDVPRYKELVSSLGIRHKAPGLVPSREEPYQRFPRQKAIKKHLVQKKTVSK